MMQSKIFTSTFENNPLFPKSCMWVGYNNDTTSTAVTDTNIHRHTNTPGTVLTQKSLYLPLEFKILQEGCRIQERNY